MPVMLQALFSKLSSKDNKGLECGTDVHVKAFKSEKRSEQDRDECR